MQHDALEYQDTRIKRSYEVQIAHQLLVRVLLVAVTNL
jgi:hypothetical protein